MRWANCAAAGAAGRGLGARPGTHSSIRASSGRAHQHAGAGHGARAAAPAEPGDAQRPGERGRRALHDFSPRNSDWLADESRSVQQRSRASGGGTRCVACGSGAGDWSGASRCWCADVSTPRCARSARASLRNPKAGRCDARQRANSSTHPPKGTLCRARSQRHPRALARSTLANPHAPHTSGAPQRGRPCCETAPAAAPRPRHRRRDRALHALGASQR